MKLFSITKRGALPLILLCIAAVLSARDIPAPMSPPRLVNDFAGIFSNSEKQALESKLLAYNDSTSTQIYVITVSDLHGYAVSDYAFRLGEEWGIGQKGKDNGAVILIKPQTANSRGQAFIATGYGLEARINDAYAGRIVRDRMIPYFQDNDYFGGVNAAVDAMVDRLSGEFDADEDALKDGFSAAVVIIIVILLIVVIVISAKRNGGGHNMGGGSGSGSSGRSIFMPPIGGGGWSGGGSFGGGRGFGGGGGGRFGGGGAGGSW